MIKEKKSKKLYDSFEKGKLSKIWSTEKLKANALTFQSNIVRSGKKAIRISIYRGYPIEQGSVQRAELLERKIFGPIENNSYGYAFSMYIPKDFPLVSTRTVLAQWKQSDVNDAATLDSPVLALRYRSGQLYITLQTTEKRKKLFSTKKDVRGRWLDFVFHIKFTREKTGFVKVWLNQNQIVNYVGATAYSEKYGYPRRSTFYFKFGLYRDKMNEPMTIYIDDFMKWLLPKRFKEVEGK